MITQKSNLIKKITLDMPVKDCYCYGTEETVGEFLEARKKLPGVALCHNDVEYFVDYWNLGKYGELAFQVNNNSVEGLPEYVVMFSGKDNFFQFIQYARYLDGTFVYEDLVDWKKVKVYDVFKPGWLK